MPAGYAPPAAGGGGGTVDVVSNVAQDRILGRTASGSGDSEELTAAQTRSLLGLSIEPAQRRILPTAKWSGMSGHYGTPMYESADAVAAGSYSAGLMWGGICNIGGAPTLTNMSFEVSASSLTAGQSVTIACYALDANRFPTGTPLWTETKVVGTGTGVFDVATTNALPASGCALFILNPSTNAGAVSIYNYQPTGPYFGGTRTVMARSGLISTTGLASPPDLTSYTMSTAAASGVLAMQQRIPLLLLR